MTTDKLYLLTEAAELTGTTVETIRQRIKRRKLHAVKGNDGRVRVRLTQGDIESLSNGRLNSQPTGQPTSQPTGQPVGPAVSEPTLISALEAHVQTLREQVDRLHTELDNTRNQLSNERAHSHELTTRLDQLHGEHAAEMRLLRTEITHKQKTWLRELISKYIRN